MWKTHGFPRSKNPPSHVLLVADPGGVSAAWRQSDWCWLQLIIKYNFVDMLYKIWIYSSTRSVIYIYIYYVILCHHMGILYSSKGQPSGLNFSSASRCATVVAASSSTSPCPATDLWQKSSLINKMNMKKHESMGEPWLYSTQVDTSSVLSKSVIQVKQ